MSLYYREGIQVHEHQPEVPDHLKYVSAERQGLLVNTASHKIAFLRYFHLVTCCQLVVPITLEISYSVVFSFI